MKVIFFLIFICLTAFAVGPHAQSSGLIREDWLQMDLDNLKMISEIVPIEGKPLEALRNAIVGKRERWSDPSDDHGFGFKYFNFDRPGGYTHFFVRGYVFLDQIAYFKIGVNSGSQTWPKIRSRLIKAWKENGGPVLQEKDGEIFFEKSFDPVFESYKRAVGAELGEIRSVVVPAKLNPDYEYLISPVENSVVGTSGCDYAGVTPYGKTAIDLFVTAGRIDLLENIFRGYNPGGRVYAVMGLRELQKLGRTLKPETLDAMERVIHLDAKIEICEGCTHSAHSTADVLKIFNY